MKFLNTNFLHNVLNFLIVAVPALEIFDWTPFVEPQTALMVSGGLGLLKLCVNWMRDGLNGMYKTQPPVT
jgi:hypothetical protein